MMFAQVILSVVAATMDKPLPTLVYPEGAETPRHLTKDEKRWLSFHPLQAPIRGNVEAPIGDVHCVAEYQPADAIMLAWEGFSAIVAEMAAKITTIGEAKAIIVVDSTSEQSSALSQINSYGGHLNYQFTYSGYDMSSPSPQPPDVYIYGQGISLFYHSGKHLVL